jgi:hypothetical protein
MERVMANTATFRIRRVKCRDEMGGSFREKFGNDEIRCAVFSADLRGSTKNSGRVHIYDDFDDGDVKVFNPPKEVVTLDLAGATGEVELGFSVVLIESQLREGDGLKKAFEAFVKIYEESLKDKLGKAQLSLPQARAVAQPGYLSRPDAGRFSRSGRRPPGVGRRPVPGMVFGHAAAAAAATVTHTAAGVGTLEADPATTKPIGEKVGDAFIAALITAVALYTVKFAGSAISALIDWSKDKFFAPVAIKTKIDASTAPGNVPANAFGTAEFRGHDGIYEMDWDIIVR